MNTRSLLHDRTARLEPLAALGADQRLGVFESSVVVALSAGTMRTRVGRVLAETTVELLRRTVRHVTLALDPSCREVEWRHASEGVARLGAVGGGTIAVVPWDAAPNEEWWIVIGRPTRTPPGDWLGVGADGWRGVVQRGVAQDLLRSRWPFGACGAAALCQAALLQVLLAPISPRPPIGPLSGDAAAWIDLWRWSCAQPTAADRTLANALRAVRLPDLSVIGAGAVGHALAWALARSPVLASSVAWYDDGLIDATGLNRCLGSALADCDRPKVDVIARQLATSALRLRATPARWSTAQPLDNLVISAVDQNATRHDLQKTVPALLFSGETYDANVAVSRHSFGDGLACLMCRHPGRHTGTPAPQPLPVQVAAERFDLPASAFTTGELAGQRVLTADVAEHLIRRAPQHAEALRAAAARSADLCGTLGNLRAEFGEHEQIPPAASFGASSLLAGVGLAAALVQSTLADTRTRLAVFELDLFAPVRPGVQPGTRRIAASPHCPGCGSAAQAVHRRRSET